MRIGPIASACIGLAACLFASAGTTRDLTIRSDVPLTPTRGQETWPQGCSDKTQIAMCSRFALGDWKIVPAECGGTPDCGSWARLDIFSPMDGGYVYAEADARTHLAGHGDLSAIIRLTPASNLYAIQVGYAGGSRYILVAADAGKERIAQARVLVPDCPKRRGVTHRASRQSSFFLTDYCAVNSMDALVAIARAARNRPPVATMTWVGAADAPETAPH